ncbi:DnaJ C-terminal domain-containing protein [Sulfobacillus harzensis]|uniref:DnaJ domain-containing protein n=1 Tax=Sulfobacillus harzensis TaxID=2729629 RepID=A0A7Y0Q396_9FIRM|nr:DnaJ C-terminal domain-containing protein [Sulfobacillus harzensis]NMP24003.1 DnaJ domain-containing protein [Sulfobacillus harzensis]
MAAPKDYYQVLEVDEKADQATIKKAYHRLARKYHPDVSGKAGEEKFKEINEAYEALSDPKKRAEYDRLRRSYAERQSRRRGPGFERVSYDWSPEDFEGFGSIFEDLFTGGGFGTRQSVEVPEEVVQLTLEQVMMGTTVNLTVNEVHPCVVCHGRDRSCPRCGGVGQVSEPRRFDVSIPPGVEDGAVLRVGEHARLKVEVAPHPRFRRQGDNLLGQLLVAVPVAAVGGDVSVQPLVGAPVMVTIPRHTNHGRVLRLKGMGLPHRGTSIKGDMLLEVALRFPEPFNEQDDRLYHELRHQHQEVGGEIHAPR